MSRRRWATGAGLAALLAAGLVQAQSQPQSQPQGQPQNPQPAADPTALLNRAPPAADPIGEALEQRRQSAAPQEEAPPAPGDVPAIVSPAPSRLAGEPDASEPIVEAEVEPASPTTPEPAGEPMRRPRHRVAVLQALDKITAETIRFEVPVGRPVRWKGLVFTVRACETTAPDEPMRDAMAYVEVRSQPRLDDRRTASRRVFQGWMFASSPGLSAMEHPVYDAWVIACQAAAPEGS